MDADRVETYIVWSYIADKYENSGGLKILISMTLSENKEFVQCLLPRVNKQCTLNVGLHCSFVFLRNGTAKEWVSCCIYSRSRTPVCYLMEHYAKVPVLSKSHCVTDDRYEEPYRNRSYNLP